MKRSYIPIITALSIIVLLNSCAKEGPTGPTGATGPAGPSFTGAISGHVNLYDQYGNKVTGGLSSVEISLNGTTKTPDSTGYYFYPSIVTGDYYITASDAGYGATMLNNFQFLSDTLNKDIKMSAIPTFSVTIASIYSTTTADSLIINCTADEQLRSLIVFVNNTASVNNSPANYLTTTVKAIASNSTKVTVVIPRQSLYDLGFASGNKVYYAVYSGSVNDYSAYEDLTTGKVIYNAVSNPVVDSAATP